MRLVQKTAMTTTATMVMTPAETMITSSTLLSRGDVGLPWGLLLPRRAKRHRVTARGRSEHSQAAEPSCESRVSREHLRQPSPCLQKCLIDTTVGARKLSLCPTDTSQHSAWHRIGVPEELLQSQRTPPLDKKRSAPRSPPRCLIHKSIL